MAHPKNGMQLDGGKADEEDRPALMSPMLPLAVAPPPLGLLPPLPPPPTPLPPPPPTFPLPQPLPACELELSSGAKRVDWALDPNFEHNWRQT